jgi:deazaflavin-dependent oxidoreductase (nitroreductase family)
VVVVATKGAKSGDIVRVPLLGLPSEEKIVLVATNFGNARNPAWYHNLKKYPRVEVSRPEDTGTYESREVFEEEWAYYWELVTRWYPGYRRYRHRASGRHVPILVLSKVEGPEVGSSIETHNA